MPPLFMYSRREKSSTIARVFSPARLYAAMSGPSETAVTSPRTRITMVRSSMRSAMVFVADAVMSLPTLQRRVLVRVDRHEVRKPRDLEDLPVVVAERLRGDRPAVFARA